MSLNKVRRFLAFYNFFALLCLRIENGKFKVSNFVAIINLFKMPLVFAFSTFILTHPSLMDMIYNFEAAPFLTLSIFATIAMCITFSITNVSGFLFCAVQFSKRRQIQDLVNNCAKMKLENIFLEKFQSNCRNESWRLVFIFVSIALCQYFTTFKWSLLSMVCSLIILYPNMMLFAYASILKNFEYFLIAHLDSFECNLNDAIQRDSKKIEALLVQFGQIYKISEDFNSAFGPSFNIYITSFLFMSIFNASSFLRSPFSSVIFFLHAGFQFSSICETLWVNGPETLDIIHSCHVINRYDHRLQLQWKLEQESRKYCEQPSSWKQICRFSRKYLNFLNSLDTLFPGSIICATNFKPSSQLQNLQVMADELQANQHTFHTFNVIRRRAFPVRA